MHSNSHFVQNMHQGNSSQPYSSPSNYVEIYERSPFTYPVYDYNNQLNKESNFIIAALNQRQSDTGFFENFINENNDAVLKENIKHKKLRISEIKVLVISIKKLNNELKECTFMLENKKDLSHVEWTEKIHKCENIMVEIEKLSSVLQDTGAIDSFKKIIKKRKDKRQRIKRLRAEWQACKLINAEKRSRLDTAINTWIMEKQQIIEQEKQKRKQRQDADMILSDIRGRRGDAKKYLTLLDKLEKLRKVQVNNASARRDNVSAADTKTFDSCIEQLIEQWSKLDCLNAIEEQGLKLMLKTDNEKILANQTKDSFDDWEIAIFGCKLPCVNNVEKNLNNLVMARVAWDKYINFEGNGSRIPIGWVMPDLSSSAAWQKYFKKD